jgi:hypothetical protein
MVFCISRNSLAKASPWRRGDISWKEIIAFEPTFARLTTYQSNDLLAKVDDILFEMTCIIIVCVPNVALAG